MHDRTRIVITGLGPLTAIGKGADPFWEAIAAGRRGWTEHRVRIGDEEWVSYPLSRIEGFSLQDHFPPEPVAAYGEDRDFQYILASAKLAIDDAGLGPGDLRESGLVLTHEAPGLDRYLAGIFRTTESMRTAREAMGGPRDLAHRIYEEHKDAVYNLQSFMYLHNAAKVLGIHGYTLFVNNSCASGLYAIDIAARLIRTAAAERIVVAGSDAPLFPTKYLWFRDLGIYSPSGIMRPFDRRRDGMIFGDGGAGIVLESLDAARSRGARIRAEYLGGGFNQEGWKVTVPNVSEAYYRRALEAALADAGIAAGEVDLLNPHGAATALSDPYEARGITEIYGDWPERPRVTCFKPYFGHNLGASALVEAAALILSIEHDIVPRTLGVEEPDPKLRIRCATENEPGPLRIGVKMSNGFAGFNGVGVFGKVDE